MTRYGLRPTPQSAPAAGRAVRSPLCKRHHAGLHQFEALEKAGDLLWAAQVVGNGAAFVVTPLGLHARRVGVGGVVGQQVTARGQGFQQPVYDRPRPFVAVDVTKDPAG